MHRIGVIGYGYWGPNLVRNFQRHDDAEVAAVADLSPERLAQAKSLFPSIDVFQDAEAVITDPSIHAVVIVTPPSTHHSLAKAALEHGKHVLVSKPMCLCSSECQDLVDLARSRGLTLMVDHTFLFSGAVRKIRELIDEGALGEIYYFDAIRINLGLFQHDSNVLWDLGPHDFSIMDHLVDQEPVAISAVGARHIEASPFENVAYVTIRFANNTIAHFHLNWLSPTKIRRTIIGGSQKMVIYDHLEQENQVKVYDKGVEARTVEARYSTLIHYRTGDMYAPRVDLTEPLVTETRHFLDCIETGAKPISDGESGKRVVELLEKAQASIERGGEMIDLR